jgi:hypothetical protein
MLVGVPYGYRLCAERLESVERVPVVVRAGEGDDRDAWLAQEEPSSSIS